MTNEFRYMPLFCPNLFLFLKLDLSNKTLMNYNFKYENN